MAYSAKSSVYNFGAPRIYNRHCAHKFSDALDLGEILLDVLRIGILISPIHPKMPPKTKKRPAEDAQPENKIKKRKGNSQNDESLDVELGLNTLFQKMDNQLLADHLAQKLTRFGSDLSPVEISDLTLSGRSSQSPAK